MSYKNPHSAAYEVERSLAGSYSLGTHGDIGAFFSSMTNADLPRYTTMFYHPTEHEMLSDLKYDKVEIGYDKGLADMREGVRGPPIEAYIPMSFLVPDGGGSANSSVDIRNPEILPKASIIDEIFKAQAEVLGRKDVLRKEDISIIRAVEIEQEIHFRRRFRRVEIIKNR
ncbi:MAG: hypothetical protein KAK00_06640 [Nanoarchaeota archaeon]|nr:hypothetical protein [Nanoarchaeota archaeon]